jgi:hydrogenase maturation protease
MVAGVGNIFLGDDAFGVEVVRQLADRPLPDGVQVADIGIRGVHLAYELLDGCDLLILIDAAQRGESPGSLTLLEVDLSDESAADDDAPPAPLLDPHSLAPDEVLALLRRLGSQPVRTLVVACEPADLTPGIDLSPAVREAVPRAVAMVEEILSGPYAERSADSLPAIMNGRAAAK